MSFPPARDFRQNMKSQAELKREEKERQLQASAEYQEMRAREMEHERTAAEKRHELAIDQAKYMATLVLRDMEEANAEGRASVKHSIGDTSEQEEAGEIVVAELNRQGYSARLVHGTRTATAGPDVSIRKSCE